MKRTVLLLTLLTCLVATAGYSQIVGPSTAVAGTPVTFTSGVNGQQYSWITDTMNFSGNFTPSAVSGTGFGTNSLIKMVQSGGNYHAFYFTSTSAMLQRLDFGNNPNSTPTRADVVSISGIGTSNNKSLEIIRDSATGRWHGFFAGMKKLWRVDFGTSLTATTPTVTQIMTLPAGLSDGSYDMVVTKDNGNWYGFIATNDNTPAYGIVRIKFGTTLTATPVELTPAVKHTGSAYNSQFMQHFTMHRESGNWYLLATNLNGQLIRFDFSASLDNSPSAGTVVYDGTHINTGKQPRSVFMLQDCNELVAYVVNSNGPSAGSSTFVKFDFKGSVLNTPDITVPAGANNLSVSCTNVSPYIYNDTLYLITPQWQTSSYNRIKTLAWPQNKTTYKYHDSSFTHTFSTPGVYNLTMYVDQALFHGPRAYCRQITVNAPGPAVPAQPGNFIASRSSVCKGEAGVVYRINRVSGATAYNWTYTPATGVTVHQVSDTFVRLDFSAASGSGTLSVTANNITGPSPARTMSVTVNNPPVVSLSPSGTQSICQGDSLGLAATATNGVTYQWLNGTSPAGTGAASFFARTAGSYTVAVSDPLTNCADTSAALTLAVNPRPATGLSHTGQVSLCGGDSLELTAPAGSGYSYQWKRDAQPVGAGARQYAVKQSGSYSVVVTDAHCTDSAQPVQITVYPRPVLTLLPADTGFCEGEAARLQVVTGDTGMTYTWENGGVLIPQAGADFLIVQSAGVYTVTAQRNILAGCSGTTNPAAVVVHPLPVVAVSWDGLDLRATAGYDGYQWYADTQPMAGATDSVFRPSADGRYVVSVTDSNGCVATASRQAQQVSVWDAAGVTPVKVFPNPAASAVMVEASEEVTLQLFSMQGRLIREQRAASRMEIDDLSDGIYLLQVDGQDGRVLLRERLIKSTIIR